MRGVVAPCLCRRGGEQRDRTEQAAQVRERERCGCGNARYAGLVCAGNLPAERTTVRALLPGAWHTSCGAGRWPLAAGRWPLAAGRWPLAAGRWPLAAGRWPLAAGRWPLAAGRWRGWPLAAGRWPLAAGRWPLAAGRWPIYTRAKRCQAPIPIHLHRQPIHNRDLCAGSVDGSREPVPASFDRAAPKGRQRKGRAVARQIRALDSHRLPRHGYYAQGGVGRTGKKFRTISL